MESLGYASCLISVSVALVTGYTACDPGMDCRGITASGERARPGIVAADPGFHSFGDLVCFGPPVSQCLRVQDTGGAIRGPERFDVFFEDRGEALEFGVKNVSFWKPVE